MPTARRPFGFGDESQVAQFFGLPRREVKERASSGQWRSYIIGGRRVFNIDELVDSLTREIGGRDEHIYGED